MLPPAGNGQFIIQALPQQGAHGQIGAPQLQQVTISQASIPTMIQQPQGQQQVRVPSLLSPLFLSVLLFQCAHPQRITME